MAKKRIPEEDTWMKPIALGNSGLTHTHQNDFPEKMECGKHIRVG